MELYLLKSIALICTLLGILFGIITIVKFYELVHCARDKSFVERIFLFWVLVRVSKSEREKSTKISIWKYMTLTIVIIIIQLFTLANIIKIEGM